MRNPWVSLLSLVACFAAPLAAGTVPEWLAAGELFPSTNQNGDRYGYEAALAGRWLAVGGPLRDPGSCAQCGEVFLYRRDPAGEWVEMDALQPSGAGAGHNFGYRPRRPRPVRRGSVATVPRSMAPSRPAAGRSTARWRTARTSSSIPPGSSATDSRPASRTTGPRQ